MTDYRDRLNNGDFDPKPQDKPLTGNFQPQTRTKQPTKTKTTRKPTRSSNK